MNKKLVAGLLSALLARAVFAFDPFEIKDIRVEGIQRTEAGTVFSYLPVKVGDTMNDEKAAAAIKALFATGFFKDVRLEIDGQVLVVVLDERPAIASLEFAGMKEFKADDIKKSFKEVGLAESRIFDRALVDRAEQELKRQYLSRGFYGVQVSTTMTPLERNRLGINFTVTEGEVAKIKQINIIGSSKYSESDLLELITSRTPGWFTWYTKNDRYSKNKLSGDLETIRSHYLNNGYLEFNIESSQVSISPDKQDIYITINISEGEKYTVSSVKLAGDLKVPEEVLQKLVQLKAGDVFSREKITDTTKAIGDRLGNEGYAFANVNAAPELDKEKHTAAFTLFVDPGRRVYVRNINVVGNTRTRDEVIRREMRQLEAAWYDGEKINKSRSRVDRLGYFDEVSAETPAVPGTTDQVDVEIKVKEKPTGNLMIGAGYSSAEKVTFSGSVQQQNVFGSGRHVGVGFNTSKSNSTYSFSYTDPYFTVDGVSQGFDIYTKKQDTRTLAVGSFAANSRGGGVRYGVPIGEDDYVNFGLALDRTTLTIIDTSPTRYVDYVNKNGATSRTLLTTAGWATDNRDSALFTTKGTVHRVAAQLSLPGSTSTYAQTTDQYQYYYPYAKKVTLALNGEVGLAKAYGGKEFPFFKNFYAGGIGSVRGYESGALGPRDAAGGALGGDKRVVGNAELLFPIPYAGLDNAVRLSAFVDSGNVWGYDNKFTLGTLRYSTGAAIMWNSPLGPLKLSWAQPVKKVASDQIQRLQFQMGSLF
jgi:outer membrane protein insertion porin family